MNGNKNSLMATKGMACITVAILMMFGFLFLGASSAQAMIQDETGASSDTDKNCLKERDLDIAKDSWNFRLNAFLKGASQTYTVTFDPQVDGLASSTKPVTAGGSIGSLPRTYERIGYTIEGWYKTANCDGEQFDLAATPVNENLTLYAKWQAIYYQIEYKNVEGALNNNPSSYTIEQEITLNIPIKTGYAFTGWSSSDYPTPSKIVKIAKGSSGQKTFSASWTINKYSVNFNSMGGTSSTELSTTVEHGKTVEKPQIEPKKDGLTFAGWYKDTSYSEPYDFDTPVTASIQLYAKWIAKVNYETNGGTPKIGQRMITENDKLETPSGVTKIGYNLSGWYKDEDFLQVYEFGTPVTRNMNIFAKWVEDPNAPSYTIFFNSNGGSEISSQDVKLGQKVKRPVDPTLSGSNFAGWYTDKACTSPYDFSSVVTSGIILYAKWDLMTTNNPTWHDVKFDANGGEPTPKTQPVENGAKATSPETPVREGFTFIGWWLTDNDQFEFERMTINNDVTLTAKWTEKNADGTDPTIWTVTYHENGGTVVGKQSIRDGKTALKPSDPSRVGYVFDGWYSQDESLTGNWGSQYNFSKKITSNVDLYAKWKKIVTIHFDSAGGDSNPSDKQLVEGEEIGDLPVVSRKGYGLAGWFDGSNKVSEKTSFTMDADLVAKWSQSTYTVKFETNGGTAVSSQTVGYGNKVDEPKTVPTKKNYTFVGWYSDMNLSTKFNFATTITKETTLYAKWQDARVKIYRFLNNYDYRHFFTKDENEADELKKQTGGWTYEGVAWVAPSLSNTPVHRFCNSWSGEHFYTLDLVEIATLQQNREFIDENDAWYANDTATNTPIYRFLNTYSGEHFYTLDTKEANVLKANSSFYDEGIAWYGLDS